jgi:hypothetical protein
MAPVGYPEAEIVTQAHRGHVDLIAMTTRGHGGSADAGLEASLGGVATAAVQLAGVPLLLVRPTGRPRPSSRGSCPGVGAPERALARRRLRTPRRRRPG